MIAASLLKEWKLLLRDLHGLAVLFVMPIAFMLIMSLALSKDGEPHQGSRIALAGASAETNRLLAEALRGEQIETVQKTAADGLQLEEGEDLLLYDPNADGTPLSDEQPLQIFVRPDADAAWLAAVKGVVRQHYTEIRLNRYLADDAAFETDQTMPSEIKRKIKEQIESENRRRQDEIAAYLNAQDIREHYIDRSGVQTVKPNAVQHSVPAWLIFGMFFIMIPLSNVMAAEQQTNTLTRLRLAQSPAAVLLAAKWLPYFFINQLQFAGMLLIGCYLLPQLGIPALLLNGSLWPYAALSAAVSAAALGYALLVSVAAKSTEHAVVLGGGGIILMAGLGGIMVPTYVMPDFMQQLSQVSPMAWGLKAFQDLLLQGAGWAAFWPYPALLAGFAALTSAAAWLLYRRRLKTEARF
ncbi:MAG: ABC transporter permease [Neisseria sp.]|nr:ABC transporter permease [Neisseria sp.]